MSSTGEIIRLFGIRQRQWQPIATFDYSRDSSCLGWFPQCRCVFDMLWNGEDFEPFGGQGEFNEQPSHWMDMPEPPQ
jgi:hypothetical protein